MVHVNGSGAETLSVRDLQAQLSLRWATKSKRDLVIPIVSTRPGCCFLT